MKNYKVSFKENDEPVVANEVSIGTGETGAMVTIYGNEQIGFCYDKEADTYDIYEGKIYVDGKAYDVSDFISAYNGSVSKHYMLTGELKDKVELSKIMEE